MSRRAFLLVGLVASLGCAEPEPASELGLPSWCPLAVGSDAVVDVSISWSFSLALLADGSVWCWGENFGYACPHSEDFLTAFSPVKADLVSCMTRIHVSGDLGVGQHASGAWLAWGVALPEYIPGGDDAWLIRLDLGDDVVDVQSLGGPFLTLDREGRVFWHEKGVRRQVPLSGPAERIQQGTFLPCALLESGNVSCLQADWATWTETPQPEPAVEIAVGTRAVCALSASGTVRCWGENVYGELGFDKWEGPGTATNTPTIVEPLPRATRLSRGDALTCAYAKAEEGDHPVWCWGGAPDGKLGSTLAERPFERVLDRPTQVEPFRDVRQVFAGAYHACVLRNDGSLYCAGPSLYPGTCDTPSFAWKRVVFEENSCR